MKKWQKKAIDDILAHFEFDKVAHYMKKINWVWGNKVPSEVELISEARRIMEDVINDDLLFIETGGFFVLHRKEAKALHLMFCIETWDYEK